MINIKVNTEAHQFGHETSLLAVIETLDIASKGIAVAINQRVISKPYWSTTMLNNEDEILIIKATQGG